MHEFFSVFFSGLTIYVLLLCFFSGLISSFYIWKKTLWMFALFVVIFFPFSQLSIFQYLCSFFGNLSVASLGFFGFIAITKLFSCLSIQKNEAKAFCLAVISMAVFLYPMSLGLSYFDPYALGFGHLYFEAFLGLGTLFWVWKGYYFLVVWWLVSYIAYLLGGFESNNLWDYLVDPIVSLGCGIFLMVMRKYPTISVFAGVTEKT